MNRSNTCKSIAHIEQVGFVAFIACLILYSCHFPIFSTLQIVFIIAVFVVIAYLVYWPIAILLAVLGAIFRRLRTVKMNHSLFDIDNLDWSEFEQYVAKILIEKGYLNVRTTEKYDLGIDVIAEKDGIVWGIQVKHYRSLVTIEAVREAVAALKAYNCDRAMVVTNSIFTEPAKELAMCNDCALIDRKLLKSWCKLER